MNVAQTQLEKQIASTIERDLEAMGYEIVRIRLMGGTYSKTLQLMIDRKDNMQVRLEDCESISKHVSVLLDVEDFISIRYNLEVSSPGVDRPLTRHKDFANNIGARIKLSARMPIDGQRKFTGVLTEAGEEGFTLLPDDSAETLNINFTNINEANLQMVLEFKNNNKRD